MTRPDGVPVNAVFGFTNMLAKLLREQVGTHIAVIFDAGRVTFRNRLFDAYKANRPPPPDELIPQFALVREATDAFCVPAIELADWEADDLIAAYAREAVQASGQVTIVSSDKDLMQLIRPGVEMLDPIKQKPIGPAEVMEKFGVVPDRMIDVQALIGDPTDNVPGVPGIGPKRAAELVNEHGDLDGVLAAVAAMKPGKRRDALIEHAEAARLSRQLVTLRADAPLPQPLEALSACAIDQPKLAAWLNAQGFRSILVRMGLDGAAPVETPAPAAPGPQADLGLLTQPRPVLPAEADAGFGPYETVTTGDALARWVEAARAGGIVALDTETDGLDAMRANLVGFSLATAAGRACYVPVRHVGLAEQVPIGTAIALLGPVLTDPAVLKVYQNAKFDMIVMA
ncbi:MAG TPA: 5'-3' exonuclease H3TH domain-containing protein, partial [Acetobacteraceae bacterium]|nr:5'-3' exonuclease H3TH domain-containing protein [Acetobacteraceae bacterium]